MPRRSKNVMPIMQLMSVLSCCGNSLMYLCSLCAARRDSRSCGLPMMLRPFRFCLTTDYNRSGLYWNPVNLCRKRVQGYQLATNMTAWGTFQASATNRRMDHCYWIHRPGLRVTSKTFVCGWSLLPTYSHVALRRRLHSQFFS